MGGDFIKPLRFQEKFFERPWGGDKLRHVFRKPTPTDKTIGEDWLVSDHRHHESVVSEGPYTGQTLRQLLDQHAESVLGTEAALTVHGRFPLLLKIIDAAEYLSVQVHPDDAAAKRLGEPDVGKTEMWHVLDAEGDSELICGIDKEVTPESFVTAIRQDSVSQQLQRIPAPVDTSILVPAGTVHAIGAGLLIAEIQQNSDLTYRVYDWGRVDAQGRARELHVDKALEVTAFGAPSSMATCPLDYPQDGAEFSILAACRYFASELGEVHGDVLRDTKYGSFHILLCKSGGLMIIAGNEQIALEPGQAVVVPAATGEYTLEGDGMVLDYYVPNLRRDIVHRLRTAGHPPEAIVRLGGPRSELARLL